MRSADLSDAKVRQLLNEIQEEVSEDTEERVNLLRSVIATRTHKLRTTQSRLEHVQDLLAMEVEEWAAEDVREKLSDYFGEIILPVSDFCDALWDWAEAIEDKFRRETGREPSLKALLAEDDLDFHGSMYAPFIRHAFVDIEKSGLLSRLIYNQEEKREYMCPEHEGEIEVAIWMGHPDVDPCPHGCEGTGWLHEDPEEEDG